MSDAARQAFEEPHMRAWAGQFNMAQPLTPDFGKSDLDAAFIANHTTMFHTLVLAAEAFPVRNGTENTSAKQAIFLRLERSIVDGFRLGYLAMRPRANLFWRGQTDPNAVKIG